MTYLGYAASFLFGTACGLRLAGWYIKRNFDLTIKRGSK